MIQNPGSQNKQEQNEFKHKHQDQNVFFVYDKYEQLKNTTEAANLVLEKLKKFLGILDKFITSSEGNEPKNHEDKNSETEKLFFGVNDKGFYINSVLKYLILTKIKNYFTEYFTKQFKDYEEPFNEAKNFFVTMLENFFQKAKLNPKEAKEKIKNFIWNVKDSKDKSIFLDEIEEVLDFDTDKILIEKLKLQNIINKSDQTDEAKIKKIQLRLKYLEKFLDYKEIFLKYCNENPEKEKVIKKLINKFLGAVEKLSKGEDEQKFSDNLKNLEDFFCNLQFEPISILSSTAKMIEFSLKFFGEESDKFYMLVSKLFLDSKIDLDLLFDFIRNFFFLLNKTGDLFIKIFECLEKSGASGLELLQKIFKNSFENPLFLTQLMNMQSSFGNQKIDIKKLLAVFKTSWEIIKTQDEIAALFVSLKDNIEELSAIWDFYNNLKLDPTRLFSSVEVLPQTIRGILSNIVFKFDYLIYSAEKLYPEKFSTKELIRRFGCFLYSKTNFDLSNFDIRAVEFEEKELELTKSLKDEYLPLIFKINEEINKKTNKTHELNTIEINVLAKAFELTKLALDDLKFLKFLNKSPKEIEKDIKVETNKALSLLENLKRLSIKKLIIGVSNNTINKKEADEIMEQILNNTTIIFTKLLLKRISEIENIKKPSKNNDVEKQLKEGKATIIKNLFKKYLTELTVRVRLLEQGSELIVAIAENKLNNLKEKDLNEKNKFKDEKDKNNEERKEERKDEKKASKLKGGFFLSPKEKDQNEKNKFKDEKDKNNEERKDEKQEGSKLKGGFFLSPKEKDKKDKKK